jgi:hypothetical protein
VALGPGDQCRWWQYLRRHWHVEPPGIH